MTTAISIELLINNFFLSIFIAGIKRIRICFSLHILRRSHFNGHVLIRYTCTHDSDHLKFRHNFMKMFHNRRIDRQMMRLEIVPANADQTTKHAKTTIQLYEKKAIKKHKPRRN